MAELMANAVVTAHNHVLRQWLRGETSTPVEDFDDAMARTITLFERHRAAQDAPPSAGLANLMVLRTAVSIEDVVSALRPLALPD